MKRIICIGNRYVAGDAVGPAAYDRLAQTALPADVEVVDGGLGGLDLLRFIEGTERVVFVDRVVGYGRPGEAIVLKAADVAAAAGNVYDHSAGLGYLLRVLPRVCEGAVPEIALVGVEGDAEEAAVEKAVALALQVAVEGGSGTLDRSRLPGGE